MSLHTLNRYIGREFVKMFTLCLMSFFILYILIDFIERSRHLFKHGANFGAIFGYFLFKSPMIIFMILPVSVLLGTLLTLAVLSKNSEITAIKAGGISIVRAVAPIIIIASLISGIGFLINEYVVPASTIKSEFIYKTAIKKQKWRVKYKKRNVWYKAKNAFYKFDLFVPEQEKIRGVELFSFDDRFRLVQRVKAERALYENKTWYLVNGVRWGLGEDFTVTSMPFDKLEVNIPETPSELKVYERKAESMSYRELREYVEKMERDGYDATSYKVDMHGKLSFPLVSIIMAVLGIPFAIKHGRQGGVAAGIGIAVVMGVIYWIALATMLAWGRSGALPPIAAAWGSHALFGSAGIYLLFKTEK